MRTLIFCLLLFSTSSVYSQLLSLNQFVCTTEARSSLVLQEVNLDWAPIPFDCENTSVLIVGKNLNGKEVKKEIKPNQHRWCPAEIYKKTKQASLMSGAVTILYENPGTYDVTITRFDQVNQFKNVVIKRGDDGCHTKMVKLEVMFEDLNKAKK
jgi:hypothetical protein